MQDLNLHDGVEFDSVVFINDVYFCMSDVLELLYTKSTEGSHITCGLDFIWSNRVFVPRSNSRFLTISFMTIGFLGICPALDFGIIYSDGGKYECHSLILKDMKCCQTTLYQEYAGKRDCHSK